MRDILGISTTKTSRAKDSAEYWVADYGSLRAAKLAARDAHPRRRKFYALYSEDGWNMKAEPINLDWID